MPSLCIKCGEWKQAPMSRCACGFQPAAKSMDQAKAYVLSNQFRSAEELNELAQRIKSGEPVWFGDDELRVAATIDNWNAAVTMSFLLFAVMLGLALGTVLAGLSVLVIVAIAVCAAIAGATAFRLMAYVDRKVGQARSAVRSPGGAG